MRSRVPLKFIAPAAGFMALMLGHAQVCAAATANPFNELTDAWRGHFGAPPSAAESGNPFSGGVRSAPNQPHPAVVRVVVPEGPATSFGSGTLVDVRDRFGLVVTQLACGS